jgi:flagellar basal body-associated protein FliL
MFILVGLAVIVFIPILFIMAFVGAKTKKAKEEEERRYLKAKADREELQVKLLKQQLKGNNHDQRREPGTREGGKT